MPTVQEIDRISHPYKVKSPKTDEQIKADAKELRDRASVDPESAQRLAKRYESHYLRRNIAQINRDFLAEIRYTDPGAEVVKRADRAYEPPDYPPRDRKLERDTEDFR